MKNLNNEQKNFIGNNNKSRLVNYFKALKKSALPFHVLTTTKASFSSKATFKKEKDPAAVTIDKNTLPQYMDLILAEQIYSWETFDSSSKKNNQLNSRAILDQEIDIDPDGSGD